MMEVKINSHRAALDDAVRHLVAAKHYAAGTIVTMPVIYPSGSSVALDVTMQGERCFVSDMGNAFDEAEMMGTSRYFKSEATRIAESYQIKFDGRIIFVEDVPFDRVGGAMVIVANASAEAARAAFWRLEQNVC